MKQLKEISDMNVGGVQVRSATDIMGFIVAWMYAETHVKYYVYGQINKSANILFFEFRVEG